MRLNEFIKTPAITCGLTTTLAKAAQLMHLREVGSLIVLDDAGKPTGIVTDRDVALKGYGRELAPETCVDAVMSRSLITISADADTSEAITKMMQHGVRRLPVMDTGGQLCGIVTFDDLVMLVEREGDTLRRALEGQLVAERPSWARGWDY